VKTALVLAACGLVACCPPARAERFDCSVFRNFQAQFACYDNLSRGPQSQESQKPAVAKPQASSTRQRKPKGDYKAN
jgi:hypothetical protein